MVSWQKCLKTVSTCWSENGSRCNEQVRMVNSGACFGRCVLLFEIGSTRCSEYGSRCNELAQIGKPQLLRFSTAANFAAATMSLLFRYSEISPRHGERSLPCDFQMCYIIIKMLCWNYYVCLMRIDSYDKFMNDVHVITPTQTYT